MTVLSGRSGQFFYDGNLVSRCSSWTLEREREALETTTLADYDATYVSGRRSGTGQVNLYFDSNDADGRLILDEILNNGPVEKTATLVLDKDGGPEQIVETVHIERMTASVSVGQATVCTVGFVISEVP